MSTKTIEKAGVARRETELIPAADIRETKEAWLIEVEMPGVNRLGLEVTCQDNELTLVGRRSDAEFAGELVHHESRAANYRRAFDLDPSIDTGKIKARIEQGLLTVTLPKAETVKSRTIPITD